MIRRAAAPSGPTSVASRPSARSPARYAEWWTTSKSPPSCGYSLAIVLKQCGQAVTMRGGPYRAQRLDVLRREQLEDVLVAHPAGRVAACRPPPGRGPRNAPRRRRGRWRRPGRRAGCARRTRRRSRPSRGPRGRRAGPRGRGRRRPGPRTGRPFVQSRRALRGWPHGFCGRLHRPEGRASARPGSGSPRGRGCAGSRRSCRRAR